MKDLKLPSTDTATDRDPVSPAVAPSEVQQATRKILASAGIELLPEFSADAQKAEPSPTFATLSPLAKASALEQQVARLFAPVTVYLSKCAERAKNGELAPMFAALPAFLSHLTPKQHKPGTPPTSPAASPTSELPAAKKLPLGAQEEETRLENVLASIAMKAPAKKSLPLTAHLANASNVGLEKLAALKGKLAPMLAALMPLLSRLFPKHEKPPTLPIPTPAAASEPSPAKKSEFLKAPFAMLSGASQAALEKARAILAPLPKSVRLGGAGVIALLLVGMLFLILRPGAHPHPRYHVAIQYHAIESVTPSLAHRATAVHGHRAIVLHGHRVTARHAHRAGTAHPPRGLPATHSVVLPEENGSAYDRSGDAGIIASVRQKIAHLCGLQVSKVYRWKYDEGYLFCYSRSGGQDTSTILERGDDGIFTLIGGTKGRMTYDEMTDTFLIDSEIAKSLLK